MEALEMLWFYGKPILLVSVIYFVVLFPTFLLLKRHKPSFWWMYLVMVAEALCINGVSYLLLYYCSLNYSNEILYNYSEIIFNFIIFGAFASVIIFLTFPFFLRKFKRARNELWAALIVSVVLSILIIIVSVIGPFYIIAWGTGQSFMGF